MKKILSLFTAVIVLLYASASFAAVGIRVNGNPYGTATDIDIRCGAGANSQPTADGSIYYATCSPNLATTGIANGGAVSVASNVAALATSYAYVRKVVTSNSDAAFTAGTLANGIPGQTLTLEVAGLSPSGATSGGNYTITPVTSTGFSSVKVSAVKDVIILQYIDDNVGWVLTSWSPGASNSITITLKN